jgi:hypothetical protein
MADALAGVAAEIVAGGVTDDVASAAAAVFAKESPQYAESARAQADASIVRRRVREVRNVFFMFIMCALVE